MLERFLADKEETLDNTDVVPKGKLRITQTEHIEQ